MKLGVLAQNGLALSIRWIGDKQVQTLCFSCETLMIVQNLGLNDEERKSVASIISAIRRYTSMNQLKEGTSDNGHNNQESCSSSLHKLVKTCNFSNGT